jgi:hypothetical protein
MRSECVRHPSRPSWSGTESRSMTAFERACRERRHCWKWKRFSCKAPVAPLDSASPFGYTTRLATCFRRAERDHGAPLGWLGLHQAASSSLSSESVSGNSGMLSTAFRRSAPLLFGSCLTPSGRCDPRRLARCVSMLRWTKLGQDRSELAAFAITFGRCNRSELEN